MDGIAESLRRFSTGERLDAALRAMLGIAPQLSRYTLVSLAALTLDFSLYLALLAAGVSPTLAGVSGYAAGTGLHYALSIRLVFDAGATDKARARLFGEFALSGLAGMGITALVIAAATNIAGLPALPAKALAAGISFLVVFTLRRNVVFATFRFALPARRWTSMRT
jgi:putative flippase GtrA